MMEREIKHHETSPTSCLKSPGQIVFLSVKEEETFLHQSAFIHNNPLMNAQTATLENSGLFVLFINWRIVQVSVCQVCRDAVAELLCELPSEAVSRSATQVLLLSGVLHVYTSTLKPLTPRNSHKHVHTHAKTHKQTPDGFNTLCLLSLL